MKNLSCRFFISPKLFPSSFTFLLFYHNRGSRWEDWKSKEKKGGAWRRRRTRRKHASRRKRFFFSWGRLPVGLSHGTPTFKLAGLSGEYLKKTCRTHVRRSQASIAGARWLPRDNTHGHRSINDSFFREGTILLSFVPKIKKQGSQGGHREHGESRHRGVSASSLRGADFHSVCLSGIAWERQT